MDLEDSAGERAFRSEARAWLEANVPKKSLPSGDTAEGFALHRAWEKPVDFIAAAVLNIASAWERADDDTANIEWARTVHRDLQPFSTGGTYVNFLTEEEGEDRTRAAYRTNYARLAQVKAAWDPDNLFRTNKNIAPSS